MRSFGNDDISDRPQPQADNFELAADNSESENDTENVAEIDQICLIGSRTTFRVALLVFQNLT